MGEARETLADRLARVCGEVFGWPARTCTCSLPACGTSAYLAEVLRRIAANLERAATQRVFGLEIMPAPLRGGAPAGWPHHAGTGRAAI